MDKKAILLMLHNCW